MSDNWFVRKSGGTVIGPFTALQIRQMADAGKINEHTYVAKAKEGPFASAGRVRGLIVHHGVSPDVEDTDRRHESLPDVLPTATPTAVPEASPAGAAKDHPLLALWTLAVSAGMTIGLLLYAVAWKFATPTWAFGASLVPLAVALFLAGGYPYLLRKTRLNRNALLVNAVFVALTLVAGLATIYDAWTSESRLRSGPRFNLPTGP